MLHVLGEVNIIASILLASGLGSAAAPTSWMTAVYDVKSAAQLARPVTMRALAQAERRR